MWSRVTAGVVAASLAAGCVGPVHMAVVSPPSAACRATTTTGRDQHLTWIQPDDEDERRALDQRCRLVGRPLLPTTAPAALAPVSRLTIATWNMHDGRGDLLALVQALRRGVAGEPAPDGVIVLLQEAVRSLSPAPPPVDRRSRAAGSDAPVQDIPSVVAALGWHFAYLPARRNRHKPDGASAADRGVAILSSLPLSDLEAIELPVERQRRLALSGVVRGVGADGQPWHLRVVSVHLENRSGGRRLWTRAAASRTRQTEALLEALTLSPTASTTPEMPLIVGGDFNTWLGRREHALRLLRGRFGSWPDEDTRPTLSAHGWRIDYLFPRLPASVQTTHRRLDSRYGSDHYPVVAGIDFGPN